MGYCLPVDSLGENALVPRSASIGRQTTSPGGGRGGWDVQVGLSFHLGSHSRRNVELSKQKETSGSYQFQQSLGPRGFV